MRRRWRTARESALWLLLLDSRSREQADVSILQQRDPHRLSMTEIVRREGEVRNRSDRGQSVALVLVPEASLRCRFRDKHEPAAAVPFPNSSSRIKERAVAFRSARDT